MINIREFLAKDENAQSKVHCLTGMLVLLDGEVRLIDSNWVDPWQNTPHVNLAVPDLKFAILLELAQMGGGSSMFFHEAVVFGEWSNSVWVPIRIQSRNTKQESWKNIDFDPETIARGKERFQHLDEIDPEIENFWARVPKV